MGLTSLGRWAGGRALLFVLYRLFEKDRGYVHACWAVRFTGAWSKSV